MLSRTYTDQLGNQLTIATPPKRIISLVPSQTELLFHLGLDIEVIGITKFCIHPKQQYQAKTKIGGTKTLNLDLIQELAPDLIIGNKEENERTQIETLRKSYPVWMSDIKNIEDAYAMIRQIGNITSKENESVQLIEQLSQDFDNLRNNKLNVKLKSIAYFIWRNPFMVAANNTFIDEILKAGGFTNCFEDKERYPVIELDELKAKNPDAVFLSSEPYPFKEKHIKELQDACPGAVIKLVDGELFSWYGNRLLKTCDYLVNLQKELK